MSCISIFVCHLFQRSDGQHLHHHNSIKYDYVLHLRYSRQRCSIFGIIFWTEKIDMANKRRKVKDDVVLRNRVLSDVEKCR
jgi:hypothetical protein